MNKLLTKIVGAALGLAMAVGVGVAVSSNNDALSVKAAEQEITFGFTSNVSGWPTSDSTSAAGNKTYTVSATSYTFSVGAHVYCNSSYLFIKTTSGTNYLGLPSLSGKKLTKVIASNSSGCSQSTQVGVFTTNNGSTAVSGGSAQTWSTRSSSYTYNLAGTAANTMYYIRVSSANAQITQLKLTYEDAELPQSLSGPTSGFVGTPVTVTSTVSDTTWGYVAGDSTATGISVTKATSTTATVSVTGAGSVKVSSTKSGYATAYHTITFAVPKTLSSIVLSGTYDTTFDQYDNFNHEGMVVTAKYSDADDAVVTSSATWTGYDMSTYGVQTVTVSYTEGNTTKTATYSITVNKVSAITIDYSDVSGKGEQGGGAALNHTKGSVSLAISKGFGNTNYFHVYKDATMTISCSVAITKIELTDYHSIDSTDDKPLSGFGSISGYSNGVWQGESTSVTFTASGAQVHMRSIRVTLASTDPLVELSNDSATSVTMLKGDTDTSVKVLVKNIETPSWTFKFDEDEEENLTTSAYISVSQSELVDNVSTLTITTKKVGSTTLKISVSGTACEDTIPVTVNAKPAAGTMVAKLNSVTVSDTVELQNGQYKQFTFAAEDTDGNAYSIAAAAVTGAKQSGTASVTISGTRVTGTSVGTAVVRYSLNILDSVYVDISFNIINDYNATVNTIAFNSNLTATQGDTVDTSDVFATKSTNTHFGSTGTIDDSEFLFSYTNDRNDAVAINLFFFDFSHGSAVDATHKSQTVYVFVSFDSEYAGTSFTITVEQLDDPLTAITLTNAEIENDEVNLGRGDTLQLTWTLTPTNPTDTRDLSFSVDDNDTGVEVEVSSTGLITVSESSAIGTASILVEATQKTSVYTYLYVNVTLESMSYNINETVSWTRITSVNNLTAGTYIMGYESTAGSGTIIPLRSDGAAATTSANGIFYTGTTAGSSGSSTITISSDLVSANYEVTVSVVSSGVINIQNAAGNYYGASSGGNSKNTGRLYTSGNSNETNFTVSYSSDRFKLTAGVNGSYKYMKYNSGAPRYACYDSGDFDTSFYKKSGGISSKTVDKTLYNVIHNNFGEGKTYEWDATCSSFNSSNWSTAGTAVAEISGFANYKLNRAVANANGNEIEKFLAKYDVVIDKFGTAYDFLGRFTSGGINYNAKVISPIQNVVNNNATPIILIISLISFTALGGYVVIRRRKENN